MIVECIICKNKFKTFKSRVIIGWGKYCSKYCCGKAQSITRKGIPSNRIQTGEKNPNWKGGRSKNNYYYKKRMVEKYPEKEKARRIVAAALRSGHLIRKPCEICGDKKSQAHHEDYSKPLKIIWLCRKHHNERHYL